MAIDLQNPQNIATGWGAPPQFSAPNIGGMVGDILKNRLLERAQQQKEIADAVKNIQEQRQASAYAVALQSSGVVPQGVDVSGLDSDALSKLATLYQGTIPNKEEDEYRKALTAQANANTAAINRGEGRGRGSNKVWIPELNGYGTPAQAYEARSKQAGVLEKQAGDIEEEQADYGLKPDVKPATHGYVMRDKKLDYARTPEERANPTLVSPSDPLTDPNAPTFTPDVYKQREAQSTLRQKILAQRKGLQDKMLNPPATEAGGGAGGGPNDTAISQANQIKADFQAGKITADQARAQIQGLNIPGLQ